MPTRTGNGSKNTGKNTSQDIWLLKPECEEAILLISEKQRFWIPLRYIQTNDLLEAKI